MISLCWKFSFWIYAISSREMVHFRSSVIETPPSVNFPSFVFSMKSRTSLKPFGCLSFFSIASLF